MLVSMTNGRSCALRVSIPGGTASAPNYTLDGVAPGRKPHYGDQAACSPSTGHGPRHSGWEGFRTMYLYQELSLGGGRIALGLPRLLITRPPSRPKSLLPNGATPSLSMGTLKSMPGLGCGSFLPWPKINIYSGFECVGHLLMAELMAESLPNPNLTQTQKPYQLFTHASVVAFTTMGMVCPITLTWEDIAYQHIFGNRHIINPNAVGGPASALGLRAWCACKMLITSNMFSNSSKDLVEPSIYI